MYNAPPTTARSSTSTHRRSHSRRVSDALSLTFDEAEAVAFALRDLALIVRAQHDVGIAEVA